MKVYSRLLRVISFLGLAYGVYLLVMLNPFTFFQELPMRLEIYQVMKLPYLLLQDIGPFAAACFLIIGGIIGGVVRSFKVCKITLIVIMICMLVLTILMTICIGLDWRYLIILLVQVIQLVCLHKKKTLMDLLTASS